MVARRGEGMVNAPTLIPEISVGNMTANGTQ
jgi:hypothetical protein